MLVLLDECVPRPLKTDLIGHDIRHGVDMGRAGQRNGTLLKLMVAERFEVLLTVDQNLEFQQNVTASGISVIVAIAKANRVKELRPLVPGILSALATATAGSLIRVGG